MKNDKKNETVVFTDGASRGNPGPGGYGIIIIEKPFSNNGVVSEYGGFESQTTNNRMELMAFIVAMQKTDTTLIVYTDSKYLVSGATEWIHGWKKNNWITKNKKPVLNRDLWTTIDKLLIGREVKWVRIPGHSEIVGNERADDIATSFADTMQAPLFSGPLTTYQHSLFPLPDTQTLQRKKEKKHLNKKAYSYVSLVNGKIKTHSSWEDCKKQVSGVSKARFKKVYDAEEERQLINLWNV